MTAEQIAKALNGYREGGHFKCHCPAHDDDTASLSVSERDGKILVKCFAGCSQEAVIAAFRSRGLWPESERDESTKIEQRETGRYKYHDATGKFLYWKVRLEPGRDGRDKEFRFQHTGPTGEKIYKRGCGAVLYRLHEIINADTILIHEGEKQADLTASWGLPSSSLDSGADSKITDPMIEVLRGKHIVFIRDNDEPGRKYAETNAALLYGVAASIKIVLLPDLPQKGDVMEWAAAQGGNNA